MASNTDFVQYIADQCSGAGEIVAKKMFGKITPSKATLMCTKRCIFAHVLQLSTDERI